ncbi:MAG: hypothetical protein WAW02_07140 [Sideroxyarcus sp.]
MKNDWPTALRLGAVVIVVFSLYQCGHSKDSSEQVTADQHTSMLSKFRCEMPKEILRIKPMQNLDPADASQEKLAREYIELKRRAIKDSWDVAGTVFSTEHFRFLSSKNYLDEYDRRAIESIHQHDNGTYPFSEPLEEHVRGLQVLYEQACKERNSTIERIATLDPQLDALRAEPSKPWLDPKKRIPCPVMQTPTCRP